MCFGARETQRRFRSDIFDQEPGITGMYRQRLESCTIGRSRAAKRREFARPNLKSLIERGVVKSSLVGLANIKMTPKR